jgi:putative ABC transport system permease protein
MITTFKSELLQLASVKDVSLTRGHPFNGGNNGTGQYGDKTISFQYFESDSSFFRMLGIEVVKHNNLATTQGVWLNETAAFELGLDEDDTEYAQGPDGQWPMAVQGIIKDFRIGSLISSIDRQTSPVQIFIQQGDFYPWQLLVEVQGDPEAALADVREVHERLTGLEFHGMFLEDKIKEAYDSQRQVYTIVMIFTLVAILISMLGLLAMSTYFIQQRASEIAIRKVFGSTRREMLRRLVLNFLRLVIIAFVIAVPVIWWVMRWWLSDYSYRINLSPWIFITAGAFTFLIAFATVLWQSSRAANANPIDSIKS